MIKKTLILTLLMLALYSIFIAYFKPNLLVSQTQWQDNSIKAQKFAFSDSSFRYVIVGSSLASRLPMDSLEGFYNLSFSGQSIFDGLKILFQKEKFPKTVFVETNVILKDEDKNFTAGFTNPFFYYSRKYLASMRDGKQPLAIASLPLSVAVDKSISTTKKYLSSPPKIVSAKPVDKLQNDLFEKLLAEQIRQIERATVTTTPQKVDSSFKLLEYYVKRLQQRNVEVIFFEMPVNPRLCNLPGPTTLRNMMLEKFPADQYKYIPQPDCSEYVTTDGLHLSTREAAKYMHYFKTMMDVKGY